MLKTALKILLIKRDKIGDMVLTTPLLQHLKAALPDCELHVLANDYNAWVLHANSHVDKLWVFPRLRHDGKLRWRLAWRYVNVFRALRKEGFDAVLVGNGNASHRAIALGRRMKGKRIIAYCSVNERGIGISDPLPEPTSGHESLRLLALAAPLTRQPVPEMLQPEFHPEPEALRLAQTWLRKKSLAAGGYLLLGLGARKQHRQPSANQVLRWARTFRERFGLMTVMVWSPGSRDNLLYPGDDELAAEILAAREPCIIPCQDGLQTVVGLAWHARTSIFPDSGLMHIAAACPGGVVGLFSDTANSSSPDVWGPIGLRQAVLVADKAVAELEDVEIIDMVAARVAS